MDLFKNLEKNLTILNSAVVKTLQQFQSLKIETTDALFFEFQPDPGYFGITLYVMDKEQTEQKSQMTILDRKVWEEPNLQRLREDIGICMEQDEKKTLTTFATWFAKIYFETVKNDNSAFFGFHDDTELYDLKTIEWGEI